ncbi:hypothetical protein SAMN05444410_11840 [Hydrobacter penzbergensis]|uniref:Uncharacterized protein n=1 Tax=Hydrobacter penzbergensis TaxID=1235997 RepID=A0A8X8LGT8_9BACT|nr:contractile injection system tape measure protein [Hydrobacter penzbergensis]SDX51167.1 hypothetical protein SAMN05444410_11840 [Hydrobacter penzbergensis]
MHAGKHIIGKQFLDITYNGNTDGIALQRTTENMLRKELLPQLEALFDRYSPDDEIISIDRLALEFTLDANDMENNLAQRIIEGLNEALARKIKNKSARPTPASKFVQLLIFYLRNGYLPWWSHFTGTGNWHSFVLENLSASLPAYEKAQLQAVIQETQARQRVAVQFHETYFWEFINILSGSQTIFNAWYNDLQHITEWIARTDQQQSFRVNIRLSILQFLSTPSGGSSQSPNAMSEQLAKIVKAQLEEVLPKGTLHKETGTLKLLIDELNNKDFKALMTQELRREKTTSSGSTSQQATNADKTETDTQQKEQPPAAVNATQDNQPVLSEADTIYINNAGLVIVAPYLGRFFDKLGLLNDNQINNVSRAITLLQHIVTGENEFEEFEVVLPKLLCGLKPQDPIPQKYQLTTADKEAAAELLQAVITNWQVLKNTSVAGLRESFLQREGKLQMAGDQWRLKVQTSSYDMLLDYLPWNIKMIKLAWMQSLLVVEWND